MPRGMVKVGTAHARARGRLATAAVTIGLALLALALATSSAAYPGTHLNPNGAAYEHTHSGPVFIRIYCPAEVFGVPRGFCTGKMYLFWRGRRIAVAPLASGDYDGPTVEVGLPRAFRALLRRYGPQPVVVYMRTHDMLGRYRTTRGYVRIAAPSGSTVTNPPAPPLPSVGGSSSVEQIIAPPVPDFPETPNFLGTFGNLSGAFDSSAPGKFGDGRQAVGGDRPYENPAAVAYGDDGLLYVADSSNNRIQVFGPDGSFVRQFGRFGFDSGSSRTVGAWGAMNNPVDLAVAGGLVFVSDQRNDRVVVWTTGGRFLGRIGRRGADPGRFVVPWGVAVSPRYGVLYVADAANYRIQVFTRGGRYLLSFGHNGTGPGGFMLLDSIAVAGDGRVFVSDQLRHRVLVFSARGDFLSEFGGQGFGPGQLMRPRGITIDGQDRLLVANSGARRVDRFTLDGRFLDSFGWGPYISPLPSTLDDPVDVAVAPNGVVYVAEDGNQHPSGHCGRFRQPRPDPCRPRRIVAFAGDSLVG